MLQAGVDGAVPEGAVHAGGETGRGAWWKKLLLGGGALVGAAAAFNALVGRRVPPLENAIGGTERWFEWRGYRIAHTVRGEGTPVLLVHGIHAAASSYEWRQVVDALARRHTVHTIDLLGFGRSARPAARYSANLYLNLLADFARHVVGRPVALVANSLSAAYAVTLAARDPGRFPALVLVAPTGVTRLDHPATPPSDLARLAVETPVIGTAMFNALVTRASLRLFLERCYADDALVTDELVAHHHVVSHQKGAKHAPAAFISHHLDLDVKDALRRLAQPTLIVWGERARMAPVEEVRPFMALKRDARLTILEQAGDLPHDERPREFLDAVTAFLDRAGLGPAPKAETGATGTTPRVA